MMKKVINVLAACIVSVFATLGAGYALSPIIPSIPFNFVAGTIINPTQMNQNFSTVQSNVNAFQTGGSWTPTDNSGAGLVFTGVNANYTQIGNMVFAYAQLTYPSTGNLNNASIAGLPITVPNFPSAAQCFIGRVQGTGNPIMGAVPGTTTINFYQQGPSGSTISNSAIGGATYDFECIYPVS